ncbi:MAG: bifunctional UDP-N-acetylglucosamine diphosphorylase/glucosamine-1-phosphate N-acetyltransferase GlmU [Erysipelotrichaceae bacterium]|jgi:bifunctional UDP-N-acetylglucosamine pyrophosphorylase/glucosamine-1-phosphate N-acetyltransferase|nr:bifunctional UDP-N-acetylglucosamine diphosphorylase/glucosamine-1-phosphate N-acetyltransferase GlmU [Erysipelotrichaceae bacterium]
MNKYGIILGAGKGTRMHSINDNVNKVAYPILGKAIVNYVIDSVGTLGLKELIVVAGHGSESLEKVIDKQVKIVKQEKIIGTGNAVLTAKEILGKEDGATIVLYGDTPLLTCETLEKMFKKFEKDHNDLTILTSVIENPVGYNKIIREEKTEKILGINEIKETVEPYYTVTEVDAGVYIFDNKLLFKYLSKLEPDNDHGEYSLISIVKMFVEDGKRVESYIVEDKQEVFSINDRFQLAYAGKVVRKRVNQKLMLSGVSIEDPDETYISPDVIIGPDTIVRPNSTILGKCEIGHSNTIGPNVYLQNVTIGNNNSIIFSHIMNSIIKDGSTIGPFARIRDNTVIEGDSRIGNFVELKNSTLEKGVKAAHLTYIGDAHVGEKTNIGCGTVTANYDGVNKFHTEIGKNTFIGSGTILVAPVKVEDNAFTAAGSTITKDVLVDEMAIERAPQVNKVHGASKFLAKARAKKESK